MFLLGAKGTLALIVGFVHRGVSFVQKALKIPTAYRNRMNSTHFTMSAFFNENVETPGRRTGACGANCMRDPNSQEQILL